MKNNETKIMMALKVAALMFLSAAIALAILALMVSYPADADLSEEVSTDTLEIDEQKQSCALWSGIG